MSADNLPRVQVDEPARTPEGHEIFMFRTVDPVVQERTEAGLPTKEERKENLDNMFVTCSNEQCAKAVKRIEIKVCGRCKLARYCSPACQKVDWKANHKEECGKGPRKELSLKLAERSLAVPDVQHFLAHTGILLLELVEKPNNWKTNVVKVVCTTQVADMQEHFRRMIAGEGDEDAQVCLAYSTIEKVALNDAPELTKLTAKRKEETFKKDRKDMDENLSRDNNPIITYYVTNEKGDGDDGVVSLSLVIPMYEMMRMATKPKLHYRSAMRGEYEVDMTPSSLTEGVNNFIRMDKQNKLRLRGYRNGAKTTSSESK